MRKNLRAMQGPRVWSLGLEDPLERKWQPTPVFLPGEFHGQRSLVSYSPWGHKGSDMTAWLTSTLNIPNENPNFFSVSPVFLPMFVFCCRTESRAPQCIELTHHLFSSGLWQFLSLFLSFMTLTVWRALSRRFVECLSTWVGLDVFFRSRLGLQVLWKKTTEMKCPFHHIP